MPISQAAAAATGSPKVQEQMTTTGAGAAIVLACLAAAALVVNANYLWHLYESGRRRASERPLPLGAPLAAQAYILGFHALPWLGYVVRDQLSMRRADFAVNLGQDAATWGLLALFILVIGLHAAACFAAAAAFAGQARALRCGVSLSLRCGAGGEGRGGAGGMDAPTAAGPMGAVQKGSRGAWHGWWDGWAFRQGIVCLSI